MTQKTIGSLAVFCLLVFLVSSLSGCRAFRRFLPKKKSPEKVEQVKKPAEEVKAPESAPAPGGAPPGLLPPPPPGEMMPPGAPPPLGLPPGMVPPPGAERPPMPPGAETLPGGAPSSPGATQALPEVGGAISVFAGADKNVAEGSYFQVDDAQASSATGKSLTFTWSLAQGPEDRIKIVQGKALQGSFKILDITEPTPFVLRLTASDGASQGTSDMKVTAYPARLELKNHLGGVTRQVERIGEMTYVSRGRTLEIYDPTFNLLGKTDLESPLLQMVGFLWNNKNYLYAFTEAGEWLLLDVTDPKGVGKSLVQKSGVYLKDFRISEPKMGAAGLEAWATGIDKGIGMLWSISDPVSPQVKLQLKGPYKDLRQMLLWGKNLYLLDRDSLYTLDGVSGVLTASLPAGGNVTGMDVVERSGKPYLVVSLGRSEGGSKASDGGLRLFEIGVGGRLGNERRIQLKGNPSIERLYGVPYTTKLLLGVRQKDELSLRVFDLASESEIPLDLPPDIKFAALADFSTGRLNNIPMAVIADASALKVLKFGPVGNPPTRYKVEVVKNTFSTLAAAGVQMGPGETSVYLMDLGSLSNPLVPALQEISTADFSTKNTLILGDGSYLNSFVVTDRPKFNFATSLMDPSSSSPSLETLSASSALTETAPAESKGAGPPSVPPEAGLTRGSAEGKLRVFSIDTKPISSFLSASRLYGDQKGPNESRPFGIDALVTPNGILVATAVSKISGTGIRSGLVLLRLPPEGDPMVVLKGDLSQKLTYIPLSDGRDVKLSRDGKWAFVAAGLEGLVLVDLEKNKVVLKSNPTQGSVADRVLLSHDQKKVIVSFLSSSAIPSPEDASDVANVPVSMSIFYFNEGQLGTWGEIKGLSSLVAPFGVRSASGALSFDDAYLFVANGRKGLWVYNATDPSSPVLIAKLPTHGAAAAVAVGQKYKNIYIADVVNGLEVAEFGF